MGTKLEGIHDIIYMYTYIYCTCTEQISFVEFPTEKDVGRWHFLFIKRNMSKPQKNTNN